MKTRPLGASGIEASALGLGTWGMGGWMWGGTDEAEAIRAIHSALEAGITLIDTAPAYGLGLSEEIIGKAIRDRRDRVILATKCGLQWHSTQGTHFFDEDGRPVYRYLGAASIRHEVEASLKRLQTDVIDLYQTHWQDDTTPIEETMQALLDLQREGKIRAIGVSNATPTQMDAYRAVGLLDSDQEQYSMLDRQLEAAQLPYTQQHNIAMLAYSPLALGLLSGKITPTRAFNGDDQRKDSPRFSVENRQRVAVMLNEFAPIAEHYQVSIAQLVIAWTIVQPGVTHVLVGARNPEQAQENAVAGRLTLSPEHVLQMTAVLHAHAPGIV